MVTKIQKSIDLLNKKEKNLVKEVVIKILNENIDNLDLKKLTGHSDVYRVRKGDIRIIFTRSKTGQVSILKIEKRNDKTYKDF